MANVYDFFPSCARIHTYDDSPNSEENKGIFLEESLDILFGDLFHFPLCLHGPDMNAFSKPLHPVLEMMGLLQSRCVCCSFYRGIDIYIESFLDDNCCQVQQLK